MRNSAGRTAGESCVVDSEGFQKPRDQRIRERPQAWQTLALPYITQMSRLEHLKRENRCANYLFSI